MMQVEPRKLAEQWHAAASLWDGAVRGLENALAFPAEMSGVADAAASQGARREALAERIAFLGRDGWRVESQTDYQAVVVKVKRPNHILHLVLSILTLGLWLLVWLIIALRKKERARMVLTVDEMAQVQGRAG